MSVWRGVGGKRKVASTANETEGKHLRKLD